MQYKPDIKSTGIVRGKEKRAVFGPYSPPDPPISYIMQQTILLDGLKRFLQFVFESTDKSWELSRKRVEWALKASHISLFVCYNIQAIEIGE